MNYRLSSYKGFTGTCVHSKGQRLIGLKCISSHSFIVYHAVFLSSINIMYLLHTFFFVFFAYIWILLFSHHLSHDCYLSNNIFTFSPFYELPYEILFSAIQASCYPISIFIINRSEAYEPNEMLVFFAVWYFVYLQPIVFIIYFTNIYFYMQNLISYSDGSLTKCCYL